MQLQSIKNISQFDKDKQSQATACGIFNNLSNTNMCVLLGNLQSSSSKMHYTRGNALIA